MLAQPTGFVSIELALSKCLSLADSSSVGEDSGRLGRCIARGQSMTSLLVPGVERKDTENDPITRTAVGSSWISHPGRDGLSISGNPCREFGCIYAQMHVSANVQRRAQACSRRETERFHAPLHVFPHSQQHGLATRFISYSGRQRDLSLAKRMSRRSSFP